MATGRQSAWWREMGAISRGMMFLDGSFVPPTAPEPRPVAAVAAGKGTGNGVPRQAEANVTRGVMRLLEDLALLGGRPVSRRHNDDIDEPFPALHRRSEALARRSRRMAQAERAPG